MQEVPVLQALLQFVRFGLPWDFGRTITIAHGDARPVVFPARCDHGPCAQLRTGRMTRYYRDSNCPREAAASWIARSGPGEDTANGETAREQRAVTPQPSPAQKAERPHQRGRAAVRSAMSRGKGMPAIPRPQENEGVGEHVRTRFHVGPKAACEIAELLTENRTERRKLVSSAGPGLRANPRRERSDR
jgi:hypothetical protein